MDLKLYLQRIGVDSLQPPSLTALRELHYQHLISVPFESLSFHCGERIFLDVEISYEKIVRRRRGGCCYESNGLFLWALQELGYHVVVHAAQINSNFPGLFGPPSHVVLVVKLDGRKWLCDVGFGEGIIFPIPLEDEREEEQNGWTFLMREEEEEWYLDKKVENGWRNIYKFTLTERRFEDFVEMCDYHQSSPSSIIFCKSFCSLPIPRGRVTYIGHRLISTELTAGGGTVKTTRDLTEEEIPEVLRDKFGIVLSRKLVPKDEDPTPPNYDYQHE
ncbi:hypothetical protein GDO86_018124 [Hymenochirus boettgeri]|uniref:arylamine N-acetyltransferase n=1 Tax=Hymenochirus boettgeri TaxID=247094 RepID=A0A8T2IA34_9PIPI|nr:hypothetical protein GDO86_018340 [Hymenochirus boettgeri]KAG8429459.1 hypothetical protein GDO86_020138 [Hymenochirus boettgeri]KAG8431580.1 hypothetical protein GDO86_018124 [Hymenochirus boettgeri]